MTSQIIHFNEGDVEVSQIQQREFAAWEVGIVGVPVGYGSTMLEAIADLNEKLKEEG